MMFMAWPTFAKAATAVSISSLECAALICTLMRACPFGTTGKLKPARHKTAAMTDDLLLQCMVNRHVEHGFMSQITTCVACTACVVLCLEASADACWGGLYLS
jgi:hypothetical protein